MLRLIPDFLSAEYSLTPELRELLASVRVRTTDRILKQVKDKGRLRGQSLTKPGTLLRDQIPVRVMFKRSYRAGGTLTLVPPALTWYTSMLASSSIYAPGSPL